MHKLSLMVAAISLISTISFADSIVTQEDTPNPGDTTTITTYTTGSTAVTDNLVSQDWTSDDWTGTMFPDSSDINESIYLTGKDGKYAESVINSQGILTENELKQGLTSTFKADIRWWNQWESTVTMTQTATDTNGSTTQILLLEDTTNHNYQFNTYQNTLVVTPDDDNTHGTLTARFDFDIDDDAGNWNGGHSGVDVIEPEVIINYTALTTQNISTIEFCWEKNPPTCPAQEEIANIEDTIDDIFEDDWYEDDYTYDDVTYIEYEYDWNDDYFYDDIYEEEFTYEEDAYYVTDEFFFEDEYYDDVYYDDYEYDYEPNYVEYDTNIELEEFNYELDENYYEEEYSLAFDDMPAMEEYFEEEYYEEEIYVETFTDDEFIDDFEEMFEEMPMENIEMTEEYFEEKFEEYFEEEPEMVEEFEEEYIVEEEAMEEEPEVEVAMAEEETMEEPNEVEEQPSSESIVTDEPEETTDVAEQEESPDEAELEEGSSGGDVGSGETVEDAQTVEEKPKVGLDIKVAAIEKAIRSKISNEMQRISVTLDVINEIVSREMIANQPDMSGYFTTNAALFDTRQLPGGDPAFFMQLSLDSYNKTIYATQVNLAGTDPLIQYQIKMQDVRSKTNEAYRKLKELLDARSN